VLAHQPSEATAERQARHASVRDDVGRHRQPERLGRSLLDPDVTGKVLEVLVVLKRRIEPDLVLLPSSSDIHQDHAVVAAEGIRAFKHATILGYELPMNTISFQHACFVRLEPRHLEIKVRHAAAYVSQQHRPYMSAGFLAGLARVRLGGVRDCGRLPGRASGRSLPPAAGPRSP